MTATRFFWRRSARWAAPAAALVLLATPAATAQLPPSARPGHGGIRAELSVPAAEGKIWRARAYRPRRLANAPFKLPGTIDLCLAVDHGGKRWRGIACSLTASVGLHIQRRGMWLECGAFGYVLGEPVPAGPTCGVVPSDVTSVIVSTEGRPAQAAQLSDPFTIRVNHSKRVLRKHGVDPERVRALPGALSLRLFLAFVDTPPTPVGERTPRTTITATRADGSTVSRTRGGNLIPEAPEQPRLTPPAGATQTRLEATGSDGTRWVSVSWRHRQGGLCANLRGGTRFPSSLGCYGSLQVIDQFARQGVVGWADTGAHSAAGFAVYGAARGDAQAITIVTPDGRLWSAQLSPVWTTVRRTTGNHLKHFRKLPRSMPVRSFLAVLDGKRPRKGVEIRTTLADGRVLVHKP